MERLRRGFGRTGPFYLLGVGVFGGGGMLLLFGTQTLGATERIFLLEFWLEKKADVCFWDIQ